MIVKKRLIAGGALLLGCAMMMNGSALAEEKRLGDYIYVPAMQIGSASGTVSVRVEGLALGADSDEPVSAASLAGAEFGVYVISGSGEVRPWANPLYPSEQMRIRTGEGETRFSLPQGAEYYLRQESAPQGYLFDAEALIPVTDGEIVLQNAMAGQIAVTAADSLGAPVAGVQLTATGEDGSVLTATTDENGAALFVCEKAQAYTVSQSALPLGVFAAQRAQLGGADADAAAMTVQVKAASRARVHYEHPAAGSVQLAMTLEIIDDNAQMLKTPLEGVEMEISGALLEKPLTITTDKQGAAQASLMEGTYDVRLRYKGKTELVLPIEKGQMIVSSGSTTLIELAASERTGRIVVMADAAGAVSGGSVTLRSVGKNKKFGPYALDAEGMAVTEPLEPGDYVVEKLEMPEGMQAGAASAGDMTAQRAEDLVIAVRSGRAEQLTIEMLSRQKQTFELLAMTLDQQGDRIGARIEDDLALELVNAQGETIAQLKAKDGLATIEALSGVYCLRMDARRAEKLEVQQTSGLFMLPAQEDTIEFASSRARIAIAAADESGEPVSGAAYTLIDSTGARYELDCDEDGMAVSQLLSPGEVRIRTKKAPQHHDEAEDRVVTAEAGETTDVQMTHQSHGTAQLHVRMQTLDASGRESFAPMDGVNVALYRVEGSGLSDTGLELKTGADGMASVQLEAGEYVAKADVDGLAKGCRAPQALRFTAENTKTVSGSLTFMGELGGVRVQLTGGSLSDEQLAQVRFVLMSAEGEKHELTAQDGAFYAGALASGTYVLRQTQIPQGYTLAAERTISVQGGEVTQVSVPLEEYAVLTVSKTGLTFDDALKTYIVPLSGQYGVYTLVDGEMKPYPGEDNQTTVWANVTAAQVSQGRAASAKLPASVEGTTYYLHELSGAQGFGADETYYEVKLFAGENQTLSCAVSSDRGFFSLEQLDAGTGMPLAGGQYALSDAKTGETILEFEMGEGAYRNRMAIPVGEYLLEQTAAAPGYALCREEAVKIEIKPYLTQGGTVTQVTLEGAPVPQKAELNLIEDMYAAREQGLTFVTVDTGALARGETLLSPQVTIETGAAGGERSNILSLVISGAGDALGTEYKARVEYCLNGGGWQPSDARMTGVLGGPTAVSLADVKDDVSAVRVTYIHALSGEEAVLSGFTPGELTLSVQASAEGDVNMKAHAQVSGAYAYRTRAGEAQSVLMRSQARDMDFVMQADGVFTTVCAGRDGRISGVAFFDEDADGVMDSGETGRYAGLNVLLTNPAGDVLDSCRTGNDGSYVFESVSGGTYVLRFDAGEQVVFSSGRLYSAHAVSGVTDPRFGTTGVLTIDGDHTDYVIQAGCIYASGVEGSVMEQTSSSEQTGFAGLSVELRAADAMEDDEPFISVTGGMGEFAFSRILPGTYEMTIQLPDGYLCAGAQDGRIVRTMVLEAGDTVDAGRLIVSREASVSGRVSIDDDGDGVIDGGAAPLEGVRVVLLRTADGHAVQAAQTVTGADGAYAFTGLEMGQYSVLFELGGQWAFTRYGADSAVYGAVSQSGSTKAFNLEPGQEMTGVNAGVTIPAQMSVAVFKDTQYDGQKGVYEEMLEGVSVSLIRLENGEDAEEITYKTNEEGVAVFAGVSPGEYVIAYQMPGQWRSTKQVDPRTTNYRVSEVPQSDLNTGRSLPFTLSMGQSGKSMYIGAMLSGTISGVAYYDDNADAAFGANESPCEGVLAELLSASGEVIASAKTEADGSYLFEGLAPGRYRMRFTAQEGCGFSGTERSVSRGGVQESDEPVSETRIISVSGGAANDSVDAGVVRLGSLSGRIWEDESADRLMDDGEASMGGVSVSLMNGAGRTVISTATTDAQGMFSFDHLRPGTYKLRVDAPQGYVFSGALEGSSLPLEEERNARGYSAAFTLLGGADVKGVGFGVLTQGVVSGRIWQDGNYDGRMAGEEEGLRGAKVILSDIAGKTVRETTTIRSGEFSFDKMMPGEYTLSVTLPDGYVFTAEGGDSIAPGGETEAGVYLGMLEMGGTISDVRIGALRPASLGGVVWYDQDDDGRRQNEDEPVQGVSAVLEMLTGADAGRTIETKTDKAGAYRFDGVMPGRTKITFGLAEGQAFARRVSGTRRVSVVPMANSLTASTDEITVTSGADIAYLDVGVVGAGTVSGTIWEDSAYNGRQNPSESGVEGALVELVDTASGRVASSAVSGETGAYVIDFARKGEYTVRVTLPEGMIFTCTGSGVIAGVDADKAMSEAFALEMGASREGMDAGAIRPAHIAGRLIVDGNEDGVLAAEEIGLSGAVVTAMQGGTVVATARTGEDGSYAFDMLRPGTYRLRIALGDEALFARGVQLKLAGPDAQEGETGEYTLEMGQSQTVEPIAVVLASSISGSAWLDADVSGMRDDGESAMTGVKAELLGESGDALASVMVDAKGGYAFNRLRSGTYAVRFTLGDNVLFTDYIGNDQGSYVPERQGSVGTTQPIALAQGENRVRVDVGGIEPGEVGDTVWLDKDGNGLQDYKEPLLPGVSLTLMSVGADGSMTEAAHTQSDKYGYYSFEMLRPGTYVLRLNAQEGDTLTFRFGAPLGEIDSDLDPDTGMSDPFRLASGQILRNIDVGLTEHE